MGIRRELWPPNDGKKVSCNFVYTRKGKARHFVIHLEKC